MEIFYKDNIMHIDIKIKIESAKDMQKAIKIMNRRVMIWFLIFGQATMILSDKWKINLNQVNLFRKNYKNRVEFNYIT